MDKIKLVQSRLRRKKIDAILISQPENRFYLSGFTALDHNISESSGYLLIPVAGSPLLLTDFRYKLQAEQETDQFDVNLYPRGLFSLLKRLLPKLGVRRLAFESHYSLYNKVLSLEKICHVAHIQLVPLENFIERLRIIKDKQEIDAIRQAVLLNEQVFKQIYPTLRPDDNEIDVARRLENAMLELGAERPSFDTIVASGPNGAKPHAVPGKNQISTGQPIIIDMGLVLNSYCSDMTRTVVLGTPSPRTVEIFRIVRKAQLSGIKALRPGAVCRDVDAAARSIITSEGFGSNFGHSLGHGVGIAVHESPRLGPRSFKKLRSGMVVTIEPGIYIPQWGGVRLENMAVITDSGHEIFNQDSTFLDI